MAKTKLHKSELEKPISIEKGEFVKLKDLMKKKPSPKLSALSQKDKKNLTLERYKTGKKDMKIAILGKGVFSINQLISEIEKGTDIGKMAIQTEIKWVDFLLQKMKNGEIK